LTKISEAKIMDLNAKYFGINLDELFDESGELISEQIISDYGKDQEFVIVAGLGGNSGDGLSVAFHLAKAGVKMVRIFLIGRANQIEHPSTAVIWSKLYAFYKDQKPKNLLIKQDCYAADISQGDVVIEALVGTGISRDVLNKRFHDVIKRISHFDSILIAIDVPVPHYTPDKTYSLLYPKVEDAKVIKLNLPQELALLSGPGEVEALIKPKKYSHKSKNGKIVVIHNTANPEVIKQNIQIAKEYETYVYVINLNKSFSENLTLELKNFNNYEIVQEGEEEIAINNSDVILFGKFDSESLVNKAFINEILKVENKKFVIFGDGLNYIDFENIDASKNDFCLLLDRVQSNQLPNGDKRFAVENKVNVITLGTQTTLYSANNEFKIALGLNIFDPNFKNILATKIASFAALNDLWLSMRASIFIPKEAN
jgi:hydroxyethylthiazole kinase-like uncharacterized protein yjeF